MPPDETQSTRDGAPAFSEGSNSPAKFHEMFIRRASKGQCINQPYLGCREFACDFRLVEDPAAGSAPVAETRDLGWMLYDMDFSDLKNARPMFFRATMSNGTIIIPDRNSDEVKK